MTVRKIKYGPTVKDAVVTMAKNAMGEYGKEVLSVSNENDRSTTTQDTKFRQLLFLEDTRIDSITDNEAHKTTIPPEGEGDPTVVSDAEYLCGIEIPAGMAIYGVFSNITITQGTVICYKESPDDKAFRYTSS